MKLLVISHTPHYLREGRIVGWGATVRELDHLAKDFEKITHVAALHRSPAPESCQPYQAENIEFCPVPAAGGVGMRAKLQIVRSLPIYLARILQQLPSADAVHIRCPANISLAAVVLISLFRSPQARWIKYAGNWNPERRDAWSNRFQRWWLRSGLHRSVVTVNGRWGGQPRHVLPFHNPCLTDEELAAGRQAAEHKQLSAPARLLYVGRVERAKGTDRAIQIVGRLRERGKDVTLDLVGDGPERPQIERLAAELDLEDVVRFRGWQQRDALSQLYEAAHFLLLPSRSEGWPKVLSEAMAYGVVPIASRVSSIPQYLERFGLGRCADPASCEEFVEAVADYLDHPEVWRAESLAGSLSAELFTYSRYRQAVRDLFTGANTDSCLATCHHSA